MQRKIDHSNSRGLQAAVPSPYAIKEYSNERTRILRARIAAVRRGRIPADRRQGWRDAPFAARRRYRQQSGQDSSLPKRSTEQVADRFLGKTDTIKSLVVRLQLSRSGGAFLPVPPGFGISFCACFSLSEKAISCPAFFKNHSCRQTYLFMLQSPLFSVLLHDSL